MYMRNILLYCNFQEFGGLICGFNVGYFLFFVSQSCLLRLGRGDKASIVIIIVLFTIATVNLASYKPEEAVMHELHDTEMCVNVLFFY